MTLPREERINVLAPVVRGRKGEFRKELEGFRTRGFTKARIDGALRSLEEDIRLDRRRNHTIDIVVDRLLVRPGIERRLAESVEIALGLADEIVIVNGAGVRDQLYSRRLACVTCGISVPEMSPRAFSFNSPHGACPECQGLGAIYDFDPERIVPDGSLSLLDGAIHPWARGDKRLVRDALAALGRNFGIDLAVPFDRLPRKHRDLLLFGPAAVSNGRSATAAGTPAGARRRSAAPRDPYGADFEGIVPNLRRRFEQGVWSDQGDLDMYRSLRPCPACEGDRLKPQSRAVRVKGRTIADYVNLPLDDALRQFTGLDLTEREALIASRILREIQDRLRFLCEVGVGYLTLGRSAATLAGGEGQRIRLATQIGASLRGVLYVLDEPSIGLHQRDNRRLLATLKQLRDLGNTVDRGRARRGDHPDGGLPDRPRTGRRRARRARHLPGHPGRTAGGRRDVADRRSTFGASGRSPCRRCAARPGQGAAGHPRRPRQQPQEHRRHDPARPARRHHRRERVGQVDARERHPVPRRSRASSTVRPTRSARTIASTASTSSTRSSRSTSRQSGGRRGRTRPPTPASSRSSASCSRCCPRRGRAASGRAASRST